MVRHPPQRIETWSASILSMAAKLNLTPELAGLTVEDILSGKTCRPISLSDFEGYLTFREYTPENLQFVIWYQDYRKHYLAAKGNAAPRNFSDNTPEGTSPHISCRMLSPRQECMCIVATFFKSGSPKELNVDQDISAAVITSIAHGDVDPNVFSHAYREVYHMLNNSLQKFIISGTINVNIQKQMYHYLCGLVLLFIGIMVATSTIMMVPTKHHPHNRAWRLFALPWLFTAVTTSYSSFRGFCSQVGGRGNAQLRAWELQDPTDEEAKISLDSPPKEASQEGPTFFNFDSAPNIATSSKIPAAGPSDITNEKTYVIAPFSDPVGSGRIPDIQPTFKDHPRAHSRLPRPKVFGPEFPVEDPRIKELHNRLMSEIYIVALAFVIFCSIIIFSVPNGHAW